jgi:23S rRNA pseudouridine2605 synthase
MIQAGRVRVDGRVVTDLARRIDPDTDSVSVDGQPARIPREHRVYAFHKPLGIYCTLKPQGAQQGLLDYRETADLPDRFKPVGRLDHDSSGLLLWTDDGLLAQALMRPSSTVWKTYQVSLARPLSMRHERKLARGGIVLDGRPVLECRILADPGGDRRIWQVQLHEGRNRQIRRMLAAVGNRVVSLSRLAIGPVALGRLRPGGFRKLTMKELSSLRKAANLGD